MKLVFHVELLSVASRRTYFGNEATKQFAVKSLSTKIIIQFTTSIGSQRQIVIITTNAIT